LLWRGQIKKCIGVFICAIIALLACFGVMVWLTSLVGGSELVHQMISGQLAILTHEQFTRHLFSSWNFVWFYCASLPVAILVIGVRWNNIIFSWDKWTLQFLRALFTWVIVIMLLTLANGVDITAMLPITPMMALIAGYLFTDEHTGTISDMMRQLVVWILSCIPFVAFILVIIAAVINYFDPGKYDTPFYLASLLLLFLTSLVSFFAIFKKSLEINAKTVLAMILALLSYIVVNLGVVEPMREVKNQTIDLAQQLLILMEKAPENLIFYKIGPQAEERLLVLDLGIQADAAGVSKKLSMIETPIFITKPQEMLTYQTPAYFVTTETEYNTFNGEIKSDTQKLLSGEIQGEKVVVFKVNTPMVEKLETPSLLHASAAQHSD
jgi:uncharacterized membrane protein (GlpM family)